MHLSDSMRGTLKTFGFRLFLLLCSAGSFIAALWLDSIRPARPPSPGRIDAPAVANLLAQDRHSAWAGTLANALRMTVQEMQTSVFDSADVLFGRAVRTMQRNPTKFTGPAISEWLALPQTRTKAITDGKQEVEDADDVLRATLNDLQRARLEARRLQRLSHTVAKPPLVVSMSDAAAQTVRDAHPPAVDETALTRAIAENELAQRIARERLGDLILQRQLAEARANQRLGLVDAREAELDRDMREVFDRAVLRLDGFGHEHSHRTAVLDSLREAFTDDSTPVYAAYEVFWYVLLTAAVFTLAAFLFQTAMGLIPAETETTLRERLGKIVERAPSGGTMSFGRTAAVGAAALGLSAATVLPSASSVLSAPGRSPVTTFGYSSGMAMSGIPGMTGPAGAAGRDGLAGTAGAAGVQGPAGAAGAAGSNGINGLNGTNGTAGLNGRDGELWLRQSLLIAKVEVPVPDQWTRPIGELRTELTADTERKLQQTAADATRYTDTQFASAIGEAKKLIAPIEQKVQTQTADIARLQTDADSAKQGAETANRADHNEISQASLWDERPWWRSFRTVYAVGPRSVEIIEGQYRDQFGKTFDAIVAESAKAPDSPRKADLDLLNVKFTHGAFVDALTKAIVAAEGGSLDDAKRKLQTSGALPFILKSCRVER
jgi:hypothetical protein